MGIFLIQPKSNPSRLGAGGYNRNRRRRADRTGSRARQRATRHSTRIEGNTLGSEEIGRAVIVLDRTQTEMQQEVRNYWRALEWLEEQIEAERLPSEELIRELHSIILVHGLGRRRRRSDYRVDECPVVDSATRRIDYAPPKPAEVPDYMADLVAWWQGERAAMLPGPVHAGLLAHRFVSIHPFPDGNGRTARALATFELWRSGYEMRGFLSLEEHYTALTQVKTWTKIAHRDKNKALPELCSRFSTSAAWWLTQFTEVQEPHLN
ncbi:Fic family protein [Lamprobacter modestohalophilus]|uniref:Fic family protein n=1 Tax=Lamprobacter modestohalophilus TaxID=1064514 RepID=UPI001F5BE6C8|nr:Fic family protein [Lamprobacter modestohalophilus]